MAGNGSLTSAAEASQVRPAALLRQLQPVADHLGRERGRLELVAHARLVHALHHVAALPAGPRGPRSPDGAQARVQRVGVAHSRGIGFRHHGHHH